MRYVIIKNNVGMNEIRSRQSFLYDIFKVYTIPYFYGDYVEMKSIMSTTYDVVFVFGHNNLVFDYLCNNMADESNIVLLTCYSDSITAYRCDNKTIFHTSKITDLLSGIEYGFNHDITDEEINLYNCKKITLDDKLNECFERVIE